MKPLVEQRAVLNTLARLDCGPARAALKRIVLSKGLPASQLPMALGAASAAGPVLPAAFVAPLLRHREGAVREPAFAFAPIAHGLRRWHERRGVLRQEERRVSRHYYDLDCLLRREAGKAALADRGLGIDCVRHARMFRAYPLVTHTHRDGCGAAWT